MEKYRPLLGISIAFSIGIWLGTIFEPSSQVALLGMIFLLLCFVFGKRKIWIIYILMMWAGVWRLAIYEKCSPSLFVERPLLIKVRGRISKPPFPHNWFISSSSKAPFFKNWFALDVKEIYAEKSWKNFEGKVKVIVMEPLFDLKRGDYLEILGWAKKFRTAGNEGEFEQELFWKTENINGQLRVMSRNNVKILRRNTGNQFLNYLSHMKISCLKKLRKIDPKSGNILGALFLGARRLLPYDIKKKFTMAGLMHIFAISGFHISLIVLILNMVLHFLSLDYRWKMLYLFLGIMSYSLLTGLQAPVMRANIMIFFYLIAPLLGRRG